MNAPPATRNYRTVNTCANCRHMLGVDDDEITMACTIDGAPVPEVYGPGAWPGTWTQRPEYRTWAIEHRTESTAICDLWETPHA